MKTKDERIKAVGNEREAASQELASLLDELLRLYVVRILDNVDLTRLPDLHSRAAVVARAAMERGDARAFFLGRRMLDRTKTMSGWHSSQTGFGTIVCTRWPKTG